MPLQDFIRGAPGSLLHGDEDVIESIKSNPSYSGQNFETYHLSGRVARRQHDGELGWAAVAAAD
jgi:hypothetical protein